MLPDNSSLETIRDLLLSQGGRVEYHQLVRTFKHCLTNQEARVHFKDCVNALADVIQEQDAKYLVLKPAYFPERPRTTSNPQVVLREHPNRQRRFSDNPDAGHSQPVHPPGNMAYHPGAYNVDSNDISMASVHRPPPLDRVVIDARQQQHAMPYQPNLVGVQPLPRATPVAPMPRTSQHQPLPIHQPAAHPNTSGICWSPLPSAGQQPPQPPPRRRSGSSLSGGSFSSKPTVRQQAELPERPQILLLTKPTGELVENKDQLVKSAQHQEEKLKEIHELARTPGRVKEHAEKWNKMTSESDLKLLVTPPGPQIGRLGESREDVDTDSGSVSQPLDPLRKRWMVASALCDYSELASMLKEDSQLANFKDITSTALHWAAKFGKEDLVELLAGKYFANPNARSGGYTPLHVCSMFGQLAVRDQLLTFQADPNIRDHSGKLARHYVKQSKENMDGKVPDIDAAAKSKSQHRHQFGPSNSHKGISSSRPSTESLSHAAFNRIGSLNMKMKKTARALTGMKSGLKSWGSSESVNDTNLMPPPKSKPSKKKNKASKSRSNSTTLETVQATNEKDSDSDYGFH